MKYDEKELFQRLAEADCHSPCDADALAARVIATRSHRRRRRVIVGGGIGALALVLLTASLLHDRTSVMIADKADGENTDSHLVRTHSEERTDDLLDAVLAEFRQREQISQLLFRIDNARAKIVANRSKENHQMLAIYRAKHSGEIAVPSPLQLYRGNVGHSSD